MPGMTSETTLEDIVRVARRRSKLILTAAFAGAGLVGLAGFAIPLRYSAKAEIVIHSQQANVAPGQDAYVSPEQDEAIVQTHLAALTSRDHLQRVLDGLAWEPQSQSVPAISVNQARDLANLTAEGCCLGG